jgi:putative amino-acid transport system substrate-binding protein
MGKIKRCGLLLFITVVSIFAFTFAFGNHSFAQAKTITVGTTGGGYPTSYKKDGKLTGFDVEVVNKIAKRLGYKVKWKTADLDGLFGDLESGRVDTIANNLGSTPERAKKYNFSEAYSQDYVAVAVTKNSGIKSIKDLSGKNVSGYLGSNTIKVLQKQNSKVNIKTYETKDQSYEALVNEHVDGVVSTKPMLEAIIHQRKLNWKIVAGDKTKSNIVLPFTKDAKGNKLRKQFNKELKAMKKDGSLAKISTKYFGYATIKKQ